MSHSPTAGKPLFRKITQPLGLIGVTTALLLGHPRLSQAQVLFQQFYYPIDKPPAGTSWWRQASAELPALKKLGVQSVWHPVPVKGGSGALSMGYDPYDLYDLGSKDQKGTIPTLFGTKDEYLAYVAAAHANGLRVYSDVVLNHAGACDQAETNPLMARLGWDDIPDDSKVLSSNRPAGYSLGEPPNLRSWSLYRPAGADGKPGTGRFPRDWRHFHPSNLHLDRNGPYHQPEFGQDYCFEAENGYVASQMIAWGGWFRAQTGVDGFRMDAIKLAEPSFLNEFARRVGAAPAPSTGERFDLVGEFWDTNRDLLASYQDGTRDRMSLFDFGLFYALWDMTEKPAQFDMRDILKKRNTDRDRTVMFVSNHDVDRFQPINRQKRALPYALTMVMAGRPSLFYFDYLRSEDKTLPTALERLVPVHNRFAVGRELVRFSDTDVLAIEREKNLLGVFNDGGAEGKTPRTLTVPTGFGQNTALRSVGSEKVLSIRTDATGAATVTVPGGGYVLLVRADATEKTHPDRFGPRVALPTTQVTEFADDLDTGRLGNTPRVVTVTLAGDMALTLRLSDLTGVGTATVLLTAPDGHTIRRATGRRGKPVLLQVPSTGVAGRYLVRISAPGPATTGRLTTIYTPPKSAG